MVDGYGHIVKRQEQKDVFCKKNRIFFKNIYQIHVERIIENKKTDSNFLVVLLFVGIYKKIP